MTRARITTGIADGGSGCRRAAALTRGRSVLRTIVAFLAACAAAAIFVGAVVYCFATGNVGSPF
jgi:hypothetical protein